MKQVRHSPHDPDERVLDPEQLLLSGREPLPSRAEDEEEDEDEEYEEGKRTDRSWILERQLLKARTILVSGMVDDKLCATVCARLLVLEDRDPDAPVSVFINSPGGSADSGFAIFDMMRFVRCPVRTIVNGLCASAAVLVFLGADGGSRFSLPGSRFLLHQPSTANRGSASDLNITAQEIVKMRERYNSVIAEATKRKPEKILEDVSRDFWLSTQEALEYKLVDRILTSRKEL